MVSISVELDSPRNYKKDWCKLVTQPLQMNVIPGSNPGSALKQTSFFLSEDLRDTVKEWCNATFGVKSPYPYGRWTYYPHYRVDGIPCIRVVLFYTDDLLMFSLTWGAQILRQLDDYSID